jgi:hypothetical protein
MKELSTKLENIVKLFKYKNNEEQVVKEFKTLSDYLKKQEKYKFTPEELKEYLYNIEVIDNVINPQIIVELEKYRGTMSETEYKEMWHTLISFLYTFEDVNTEYIETGEIKKAWFGFARNWLEDTAVPVYFKLEDAKRGSYAKNISEAEKKEIKSSRFEMASYNVNRIDDNPLQLIPDYIQDNLQIVLYRFSNKNRYIMIQGTYKRLLELYPTYGMLEFRK